jgi:hypothetical protein
MSPPLTISYFHVFVVLIDCNKLQSTHGDVSDGTKLVQSFMKIREIVESYDDLEIFLRKESRLKVRTLWLRSVAHLSQVA